MLSNVYILLVRGNAMLPFQRTFYMLDNLQYLQAKHNEQTITLNGVEHRMLNHHMSRFLDSDKPLASIGAGVINREILIVKNDKYWPKLLEKIRNKILDTRQDDSVMATLKALSKETRTLLPSQWVFRINQLGDTAIKQGQYVLDIDDIEVPLVDLQSIVEGQDGVCRHHSLLNCLIIEDLIKHGVLPPGEARHHRQEIKEGAHAWNIYIEYEMDQKEGAVYSIDTLHDCVFNATRFTPEMWHPLIISLGSYGIFDINEEYIDFAERTQAASSFRQTDRNTSLQPKGNEQQKPLQALQQPGVINKENISTRETNNPVEPNAVKKAVVSVDKRYQLFGFNVHGYDKGSRCLRNSQAVKDAKVPLLSVSFKEEKRRQTRESVAKCRYRSR